MASSSSRLILVTPTPRADDTANFLAFFQELRKNPVAAKLVLSAAVSVLPFYDATENHATDVSGFAKVLDYIVVMNYDVLGSWFSNVGPNSPLNDTCAVSTQQQGSAVSAVEAWTKAGIPVDQIVLGVPAYGHSFSVPLSDTFTPGKKELAAYPSFNTSNQPLCDAWDDTGSVNACGVFEGPSGT
ncbi:glycoside hydrolase [Suillus decipiens]|nr:glycoside hydrolase [Suillus decipiens]